MGKILIVGDIHGNLPALELLFKIETDYDEVICHGDVVNYGPWSNECVQFLESVRNCRCLRGNHEDYFIKGEYGGTHPLVKKFFDFCFEKFSRMQAIQQYGDSISMENFRIQHTVLNQYIFQDTELSNLDGNYIIGHSHQQFHRRVGKFDLINTGSLGQNRTWINVSNYITYDRETRKIDLKQFVYNVDHVIQKMKSLKYPDECIEYYQNKKRLQEN